MVGNIANLRQAKTKEEIKKLTVNGVKKAYDELAVDYNHLINLDYIYCPECGKWKSANSFYKSNKTKSGIEHLMCKACILDACTDVDKDGVRIDNRQKTIETFKRLDWVFVESDYNSQLVTLQENVGEKIRSTAVQTFIVMIASLPQYRGKTFKDSEFLDEDEAVLELTNKRKPRKEIMKLFGSGFTNDDYLYLQDQYDDWCARTQVDSKSQQTYIVRICFKLLDIYKAQKAGKDTEKLDRSLNDLLAAANLQPRQNVGNAATDSLTFSQLIQKWELEKPIPEPDPDLCDVSGIGKKIRVWFGGWLANALGLDVPQSQEYTEEIEKYTIRKPEAKEEDGNSNIYNKMYGSGE